MVLEVAGWLRSECERVSKVPLDQVLRGEIGWTFPRGVIVTEADERLVERRGNAGLWRSQLSVDGRVYWWNVVTRESRWERPAGE